MRRPTPGLLVFVWCALFVIDPSQAQPWPPTKRSDRDASAAGDPGPRIVDCHSALRPGWTRCATLAQQAQAVARKQGLDANVAAFLANYGKPPQEAVRALLDPTDDNIRAWIRTQEKTLAVAAYVAQRMTALQQGSPAGGALLPFPSPPSGIHP